MVLFHVSMEFCTHTVALLSRWLSLRAFLLLFCRLQLPTLLTVFINPQLSLWLTSFLDKWTMCPLSYVIPSNSQLNMYMQYSKQIRVISYLLIL